MAHNKHPKVVHDCHETLKWLIPQLDKFPRVRRYTLGEPKREIDGLERSVVTPECAKTPVAPGL